MAMPPEPPLPPSATRWAVTVDAQPFTYGESHEIMHRDIALGNDFRKERIKLLITIASGVFALTVTFHKDLFASRSTPEAIVLLTVGFLFLLASLLCGIWHFQGWEDFYLEHRGLATSVWRHHAANGDVVAQADAARVFHRARRRIEEARRRYRHYDRLQVVFLMCGLAVMVVFVAMDASTAKPVPAGTAAAAER